MYILKSLYLRIPSTATVDQDAVQQANNILAPDTSSKLQPDVSSRLQPDTSSSPESTTTPSPMKHKVLAPWRQPGRETPKAQNVSKDNVYDFDGKIKVIFFLLHSKYQLELYIFKYFFLCIFSNKESTSKAMLGIRFKN